MVDRPVEVVYFYQTKWGHHDEFLELFTRNHLPVLQEQVKTGRMLDVRVGVPRFHGDGRAAWDVMVTIVYRDWAAMEEHSEAAIVERLFPDQERYREEERRRFAILEAHWDVPLEAPPG
jgi:quinol monooxygenase YgiN